MYVVFTMQTSEPASLLTGFTIVNGLAASGGAMLITGSASPYISYCAFTFNVVTCYHDPLDIVIAPDSQCVECQLDHRWWILQATDANTGGGAIAVLNNLGLPIIDSCTFTANYGPSGGAIFINNAGLNATANPQVLSPNVGVMVVNCVLQYNDAYAAGAGRGGGLFRECLP